MSILNLVRDYGVNPAIVRMTSDDSYADITSAGYLTSQMADFNKINGGAFQWTPSDIVLCYYYTGWQFFTVSDDFTALTPFIDGGVTPTQVQQNDFNYTVDTGTANAYIGALNPAPIIPFEAAISVIIQALHTNTGASTLTLNGTTVPIVGITGGDLNAGEIVGGGSFLLVYSDNYNAFILINSAVVTGTGTVGAGTINDLAWYAASGTTISSLATANNGLLTTDGSGVPSIGNSIGADITVNSLTVGRGAFSDTFGTNSAFGNGALSVNAAGISNFAGGYATLSANINGSGNTAVGTGSSQSNDGSNNTMIGQGSGSLLGVSSNGDNNVLIGASTGTGGLDIGSQDFEGGGNNIFIGYGVTGNNNVINGSIGIGALSTTEASTGSTSSDLSSGIAIGSVSWPVGFRGDGSAFPAGDANYWRVKVNETNYKIPILPDATTIQWPASGTLATVAGSAAWTVVTSATQSMAVGASYISDYASGTCVFTLPATAAVGTELRIKGGFNGSVWRINQGAGQQIQVGNVSSTLGNTGYVQSTDSTDSLSLVCLVADTIWGDFAVQGSIDLK